MELCVRFAQCCTVYLLSFSNFQQLFVIFIHFSYNYVKFLKKQPNYMRYETIDSNSKLEIDENIAAEQMSLFCLTIKYYQEI